LGKSLLDLIFVEIMVVKLKEKHYCLYKFILFGWNFSHSLPKFWKHVGIVGRVNHGVICRLNSNGQWTTLRIFWNAEMETLFKASRNYKDNTILNQIRVFSFAL